MQTHLHAHIPQNLMPIIQSHYTVIISMMITMTIEFLASHLQK